MAAVRGSGLGGVTVKGPLKTRQNENKSQIFLQTECILIQIQGWFCLFTYYISMEFTFVLNVHKELLVLLPDVSLNRTKKNIFCI